MAAAFTESAEIRPGDIAADADKAAGSPAYSPETEVLTAAIDANDPETIVTFGARTAEKISRASDAALFSMRTSQTDESGKLLSNLADIMSLFDIREIRGKPSLFGKAFGSVRKQPDRILAKYRTMAEEADSVCIRLMQYENELRRSDGKLEALIRENEDSCRELDMYIAAGERECRKIAVSVEELEDGMRRTGDQTLMFRIRTLRQAHMLLERRTQDLRTARAVATQSIPMLKSIQSGNMNLAHTINSAFIVTLPAFRQALTQALTLKQRELRTEAMSALEKRTGEALTGGTRGPAKRKKLTTGPVSSSTAGTGALETAWKAIVSGIAEVRKVRETALSQRTGDIARLERIRKEFQNNRNTPRKS